MAKKTTDSKIRFNKLWLAIALLAVLQTATLCYIIKLHRVYDDYGDFKTNTLINTVESRRYKEPVINVGDGKVYLPELRIFVPLNETSRDLRYDVRTIVSGTTPENVYFSLPDAIGQQTEVDDPRCDKMVRISTANTPEDHEQLAAELPAAQSGLRFVFKHNDCQIYADGSIDKLVDVARSIKQY